MVTTIDDVKARQLPPSRPWENISVPSPSNLDPPAVDLPPSPPPQSRSSTGSSTTPTILTRQLSSFALIILLYTAAMPFEPFAWMLGRLSGTFLFDRLLGGIILFSAFYFQWQVASLRASVIVHLPALTSDSGTRIQNGRVVKSEGSFTTSPVWVWRTNLYWTFAISEAVLLILAEFGPSEMLRRVIVIPIVAGLWAVGFAATPESYKRWAWGHIKAYLFFMVLDELRRVAWSAIGANSNGRRVRQARW